jgi:xylulokinase
MLPGDYIALKMSGIPQTTTSGLSEAILWDYKQNAIADLLLNHYGISRNLIPDIVPTFGTQSQLSVSAAKELGLKAGTKITYRSGDQPNNAFSLNVLNPGELAATAGTSGVIYGVTNKPIYDTKSRVNTFIHVNNTTKSPRYGVLLCVNGTGSLNSWLRQLLNSNSQSEIPYQLLNEMAAQAPAGAVGLNFYPFGNGAERILENKDVGAALNGLQFNTHNISHLLRSSQEGIAFALNYGLQIMRTMQLKAKVIRAGEANMFLSPLLRQVVASVTGTVIELYKTDGAQGAARGAAVGYGYYSNFAEAFQNLQKAGTTEPNKSLVNKYHDAYNNWLIGLKKMIDNL